MKRSRSLQVRIFVEPECQPFFPPTPIQRPRRERSVRCNDRGEPGHAPPTNYRQRDAGPNPVRMYNLATFKKPLLRRADEFAAKALPDKTGTGKAAHAIHGQARSSRPPFRTLVTIQTPDFCSTTHLNLRLGQTGRHTANSVGFRTDPWNSMNNS